jgi:L-ascorbate metabolism protein UlaG (beta-lactamase superfamily)
MAVTIQWFGHASFAISNSIKVYIDPWKCNFSCHNADFILISHSHYDHFSTEDIEKVSNSDTRIIGPADVIKSLGRGEKIKPGQTLTFPTLTITAVAAYNPDKPFHPKSNHWVGYVLEIESKRIYYAGDTDLTPEMQALENIDLALLPVGGTYTFNGCEAAAALATFHPKQALPYHWGDIVGSKADAQKFTQKSPCSAKVIIPGESITI